MSNEPDFKQRQGVRFDATINLGHVMSAIMMGAALVTVYVTTRVTLADQDSRLKIVEAAYQEQKQTLVKLADSATSNAMTQQKLALTLEFLSKKP